MPDPQHQRWLGALLALAYPDRVALLRQLDLAAGGASEWPDLASFWRSTYAEVKKDLKGRYPKHYWPDDPLVAEPTARVKPRK